MRFGTIKQRAASPLWLALICVLGQTPTTMGDEPSRLGRLFRLGSASDSSKANASGPAAITPANPALPPTMSFSYGQPALSTPPSNANGSLGMTPAPRITPKPRVNKAATEADPLVSRVSIGRADGGSQFGMFTQVFADGTVIDSEGVHKVGPEVLKPVVEAVTSGDFAKIKGHCGGSAGDTFENFHVVTYERAYGRLRANAFSYSGNPQGCDHSVYHLHKVLDELQMKMSAPGASTAATTPTVVNPPAPAISTAPVPMAGSGGLPMPGLPDPGLH